MTGNQDKPAATRRLANKYLTFCLAAEEYGIGQLKVKEIIGLMFITPIPQTPDFFKGVINLRGKVIPITDLRRKFGLAAKEDAERTGIIVVEINRGPQEFTVGLVLNAVSEVAHFRGEEIDPAAALASQVDTSYILGMAQSGGRVKILLDIIGCGARRKYIEQN